MPTGEKRKKIVALIALMLAIVCTTVQIAEASAVLSWGSRGEQVRTMQVKLRQWGYYSGTADGIFGKMTYDAVVLFQRRNGLRVDGVVGSATAAAMGLRLTTVTATQTASATSSHSTSEVDLLARIIHGEARGEPYIGKVAVGAVVLNRVRSSSFPNTISAVIHQPGAFDAVRDGQIWLTPDADSRRAARDVMNGWDPTGGCLYFFNPRTSTSAWIRTRKVQLTIGRHSFAI